MHDPRADRRRAREVQSGATRAAVALHASELRGVSRERLGAVLHRMQALLQIEAGVEPATAAGAVIVDAGRGRGRFGGGAVQLQGVQQPKHPRLRQQWMSRVGICCLDLVWTLPQTTGQSTSVQ